jgi:hypothetical protein
MYLQTTADYDKTGARYGRSFLWTTLRFYTPFLLARSRSTLLTLEQKAGPFKDHAYVDDAPPAAVAGGAGAAGGVERDEVNASVSAPLVETRA